MKLFYTFLLFIIVGLQSFAQKKLSLSVYAGSGISMFGGGASSNSTVYNVSDGGFPSYVGQPFGRKAMINYFGGFQGKLELKNRWLVLFNAQYEVTGGKIDIDRAVTRFGTFDTTGNYKRVYDFISLHPQFGKIFYRKKIDVGGAIGVDFAIKTREHEELKLIDDAGNDHHQSADVGFPNGTDFRLTANTFVTYKKWTFDLGIKKGFGNYSEGALKKVKLTQIHLKVMFTFLQ